MNQEPLKQNILVVDDVAENRDLLRKTLSSQGHTVLQAEDGVKALEVLNQTPNIDLVLLDYMMPNMNGYDTLKNIKSSETLRHIPVLMISAANELEKIVECIEAGADDYLSKPFNVTILRARIHATSEKKRLRIQEAYYQEQLRIKQNEILAKQKMASAGELTAGIAHEIKNPLNFVQNFAELVCEQSKSLPNKDTENVSKLMQNSEKIVEHAKRMDQIIRYMLSMSKSAHTDWEKDDINNIIEQALFFAHNSAKGKDSFVKVNIEKNLDPNLPRVFVLSYEVNRSILNMLDNAFYILTKKRKAKGETYTPTLSLTTTQTDSTINIVIRDNGEGITLEQSKKVFIPFFTTKSEDGGTGLGLSFAYETVVEKHKGVIQMRSLPGEWTEFLIELPKRVSLSSING